MMSRPAHFLAVITTLLFAVAATRDSVDRWIDRTELPSTLSETSVEVLDRNGVLLRAYQVGNGIWRMRSGEVDARYVEMLLRYEDKRFLSHSGVDPLAISRAIAQAIWHGKPVSGGSTLTMQVARLLEDGTTGRWAGKLRQMRVALALERRLSKSEILDLYLIHAPFGGNLEGVRAASRAWFGKDPIRLTAAEAALLVALPQSPELRRPDRFPNAAREARDRVLRRMAQHDTLPSEEVAAAMLETVPQAMRSFPQSAPHLADHARLSRPEASLHQLTLDKDIQHRLERLAARVVAGHGPDMSAALVVADHGTGDIIASVGSPGLGSVNQGFVDMTRAIRSPGSALKPLVYGLAFDQGLAHPETLIRDAPVMFGRYAPRNFDGVFRGDVRMREALQLSLNIPVVTLTNELGPNRVLAALKRSGMTPQLPGGRPGLAISLGGIGVSLRDLVQLYSGLAQGGQGPVLRYRSDEDRQQAQRVISEVAAWHLSDILRGLTPPRGGQPGVLAYKTGTSYGHRDAWAIGYDGQHVIGVWMGRPDGTPVPGAFGGALAAPVLFEAFGHLKAEFKPFAPPPPDTLILGAAELPLPLRRFKGRQAAFETRSNAPQVLFPPDGAILASEGAPVFIKLKGGVAPFTVLADGAAIATGIQARAFEIPHPGVGYSTLVVLDSSGQSDRVAVRLD